MRGDYYNPGPPWKAIFRDKKGFVRQEVFKRDAPDEWTFYDNGDRSRKHEFKKIGSLGNLVIYQEI